MSDEQKRLKVPNKLLPMITEHCRIKVAFGGRGGGKTESFARLLVVRGTQKKQRAFCLRQHMNSIEDSVHSVLGKSIAELEVDGFYEVQDKRIKAVNGSAFFYGQLDRNLDSIKSKDEVDVAWVEEAESVTQEALDKLIPSIRADGSEIWFSFNPDDPEAPVYKTYVEPYLEHIERDGFYKTDEYGGLMVIKVDLEDNPLAPKELHDESAKMKEVDYQKWLNVWGGYARFNDDDDNLIKSDFVIAAAKADLVRRSGAKVIGVDPARFGNDKTAIIRREGREAHTLARFESQTTMQTAGRVALLIKVEQPDMVFIDIGGLGAGVVDRLHELGYRDIVKGINFGSQANQKERFANKRAEIWHEMKDWLEQGGVSIPDDGLLIKDLVTPKYEIQSNGKIRLESKEKMKRRGIKSPDAGDALALTFSEPVAKRSERDIIFEMEPAFHGGDSEAGY